jgi:hypothetical protein
MTRQWGPTPVSRERLPTHAEPSSLVDILERVLDKGIVVAGDIRVDLLDIELLTIRLRLLIASVERAKEIGIDWWEHDPTLSSGARDLAAENRQLRERIGALEAGHAAGPGSRARRPESAVKRAAPRGSHRSE